MSQSVRKCIFTSTFQQLKTGATAAVDFQSIKNEPLMITVRSVSVYPPQQSAKTQHSSSLMKFTPSWCLRPDVD